MTSPPDSTICQQVLECLPTGVFAVDREGKINFWNAGAERITGYLKQEVLGRVCSDGFLEHSEAENNTLTGNASPVLATLRAGRGMAIEASLKSKSGHSIPVRLQTIPLRNDGGTILGAVEIFDPTSSTARQNRRQSKLVAAGCLDTLTGALNHAMIHAHLREQISLFAVYSVPFVVLCIIAIDDLVKLRERFGQAAVDAATRVIAQTPENGLRPTDYLGRWLEQEFLVILTEHRGRRTGDGAACQPAAHPEKDCGESCRGIRGIEVRQGPLHGNHENVVRAVFARAEGRVDGAGNGQRQPGAKPGVFQVPEAAERPSRDELHLRHDPDGGRRRSGTIRRRPDDGAGHGSAPSRGGRAGIQRQYEGVERAVAEVDSRNPQVRQITEPHRHDGDERRLAHRADGICHRHIF